MKLYKSLMGKEGKHFYDESYWMKYTWIQFFLCSAFGIKIYYNLVKKSLD